jgi:hypothetical protein
MTIKFTFYTSICIFIYLVIFATTSLDHADYYDYVLYSILFLIINIIFLIFNKNKLVNILAYRIHKKSQCDYFFKNIWVIFSVLLMLWDREMLSDPFLNWEETRGSAGIFSSISLIYLFIYFGYILTIKVSKFKMTIVSILLLYVVIITGSRMMMVAFALLLLQKMYAERKILIALIISISIFPVFSILRILRGGGFHIGFSDFDVFGGERELFSYVSGAREIMDSLSFMSSSIIQNLLVFIAPIRKYVAGNSVQAELWMHHYMNNFNGYYSQYYELVNNNLGGSHHPLFYYEYMIGVGVWGAFISIPFAYFLISILEKIFKYSSCAPHPTDLLLVSSAIFFVRGNSVVGFTQLFMGLLIYWAMMNSKKITLGRRVGNLPLEPKG